MSGFSVNRNVSKLYYRNNCLLIFVFTTLLCCFFILFPSIAEAKIFDPVSSDKSVEYLSMIFGHKIGNIYLSERFIGNQFLANVFQIFNGFILAVAIFILSYVSIVSTINTAHEGQVMGKKWSSIWIPLRSVIGLLLLAPVPGSGYSSLQVAIMWIVLNGIGAADHLWNFVLNNLSQTSKITQEEIIRIKDNTALNKQGTELAKNLFNSLVCVKVVNDKIIHDYPYPPPPDARHGIPPALLSYRLADNREGGLQEQDITMYFANQDDPNSPTANICGKFKISANLAEDIDLLGPNNNILDLTTEQKQRVRDLIYAKKKNTVVQMLNEIQRFVDSMITVTFDPRDGARLNMNHLDHLSSYLYKVVQKYQQSMLSLTKKDIIYNIADRTASSEEGKIPNFIIKQGKNYGWITAGSYYYLLSQRNFQNLLTTATEDVEIEMRSVFEQEERVMTTHLNALADHNISIQPGYINPIKDTLGKKYKAINNLFFAPPTRPDSELYIDHALMAKKNNQEKLDLELKNRFFPKIITFLEKSNNKKFVKFVEPYLKQFDDLSELMLKDIQNWVYNRHHDPLISQATFGVELMRLAEDFWIQIINKSFSVGKLAEAEEVESNGMTLMVLIPVLIFAGIIWTIGASFSVYMPMIPYMMFIVTALGWFILVIEAIVAAPIVALGFIMPSQDELGKVAPALGIIANIFLKPILILLGLIMAAKLYGAIINMVNMGFKFSFAALHSQTGTTTFAWIVMLVLYSTFIVTLVNKCYAIIYQLPDKLLRWIGINNEQTDISSIKETQQTFEHGTKQGTAPMEGTAIAAASKLKENIIAATRRDGSGLAAPTAVAPAVGAPP